MIAFHLNFNGSVSFSLGYRKVNKKVSLAVNLGHLEGKIDYFLEINFFLKKGFFFIDDLKITVTGISLEGPVMASCGTGVTACILALVRYSILIFFFGFEQ